MHTQQANSGTFSGISTANTAKEESFLTLLKIRGNFYFFEYYYFVLYIIYIAHSLKGYGCGMFAAVNLSA
jgi:hypothetical protein